MHKFSVILFACCMAMAVAAADQKVAVDYIVAIVNDTVITQRQVEEHCLAGLEMLERDPFTAPQNYKEKQVKILREGRDQLVENQLILNDFATSGNKMPDAILDEEVERRIRKKFGDRTTMTKTLKAWGMTPENYRQRIHDDIVLEYMKMKNVSSAVLVSPQKIEQYYKTNQARYQMGDEVKLRMIVLSRVDPNPAYNVRAMAQEIVDLIDRGAPFPEMAAIHSEGTQRRESGDWGWVSTNSLAKGLADIAFALNPGQHSRVLGLAKDKEEKDAYWLYQYDKDGKVVQARRYNEHKVQMQEKPVEVLQSGTNVLAAIPDTFYIMSVEDKRAARTKLLNEVRDEIEAELKRHEQERLHNKWIDRLKVKSFVRYFT